MARRTSSFFFFNDTATTEIYTLSLHDALPILQRPRRERHKAVGGQPCQLARAISGGASGAGAGLVIDRSEEHTSELQSQSNLVCRLLLEKKKIATDTAAGARIEIAPIFQTCSR